MTGKQNVGYLTRNLIRLGQSVLFGLLLVHACHGKRGGGRGRGGSSKSSRGTGASSNSIIRIREDNPVTVPVRSIFDGDSACTSGQLELIHNCSTLMVKEMATIPPEAKEVGAGFWTGQRSSLEHGTRQLNLSEIAEILRTNRNESREIVHAVCRGMNKFINCSEQSFKESDCNPQEFPNRQICESSNLRRRFPRNDDLQSRLRHFAIEDTDVTHCLERGANSSQKIVMKVMQDRNKTTTDAECTIIASVLECFGRRCKNAATRCTSNTPEWLSRVSHRCLTWNVTLTP